MSKKWIGKASLVVAIGSWLLLVWLHTFTHLTYYDEHVGIYSYLFIAVMTMAVTLFYSFCFVQYFELSDISAVVESFERIYEDDLMSESPFADKLPFDYGKNLLEDNQEDEGFFDDVDFDERGRILQHSLMAVAGLAFVFLLILSFEAWTGVSMYTGRPYITIGRFIINKKYIFDPVLFVIFPLWAQIIFTGLEKDEYKKESVISGCIQFAMISVMSFLLFMKLSNIWLIELCFMECFIVIHGVRKYVWPNIKRKGNAVALLVLYVFFWCVLLSLLHYSGQTVVQYTYGDNWAAYRENVFQILSEASSFGSSVTLAMNSQVQEFLLNRNNYLLSVLYYNGWIAVGFIIILLVVFLISTRILLRKAARNGLDYLIYHAAWWSMALRVIIGILYSLGLIALPISLPFAGELALLMDTIALGVLVWCAIENIIIDEIEEEEKHETSFEE